MRWVKGLISIIFVLSLNGCGDTLSKYQEGKVIEVKAEEIFTLEHLKNGEEIVAMKDKDENIVSKDTILILNKEKDKIRVFEVAEEGFIIGETRAIDDILIWEEYEEKNTNIDYKLKCRKLDSEEAITIKSVIVEEMNYKKLFDVHYNGKNIAYKFVEFNQDSIETFNLETKKRQVEYTVKRIGEVDKEGNLNIGKSVSSTDIDNENIVFAENIATGADLYYYKLGGKPKKIKSFNKCVVNETFIKGEYIYLNCSKENSGLEHIKRINIKTLEEEVLVTVPKLKKVKDIGYESNPIYIESVTEQAIKFKTNTEEEFIYKIKDKNIELVEK